MTILIIEVDFDDDSDFDFAKTHLVAAVEDKVGQLKEENRFDGNVDVSWDVAD